MVIKLNTYTEGDRHLIGYITKGIAIKENISVSEAFKYIDESFFFELLEEHSIFVHHEDPDKWIRNLIKVYRRDRGGV